MQPFNKPLGGCCTVLSYLDPLMGHSETPTPVDSSQLIARNSQLVLLANQGNEGVKLFYTNPNLLWYYTPGHLNVV